VRFITQGPFEVATTPPPPPRAGAQLGTVDRYEATRSFLGWFEAREWEVEGGRTFTGEELSRGAQVAILGQTVAQNLFGESDPLGQALRIRNVPFTVIGILAKKGQSGVGQDQDDIVVVPLVTARQRVIGANRAKARSVNGIYVKMAAGASWVSSACRGSAVSGPRTVRQIRAVTRVGKRDQPPIRRSDVGARPPGGPCWRPLRHRH